MKLKHKTMNKRNYTKFYALLRQCPSADKDELVLQYTDGRTTHLTQMTEPEYQEMVAALEEAAAPSREDLNLQIRECCSQCCLLRGYDGD